MTQTSDTLTPERLAEIQKELKNWLHRSVRNERISASRLSDNLTFAELDCLLRSLREAREQIEQLQAPKRRGRIRDEQYDALADQLRISNGETVEVTCPDEKYIRSFRTGLLIAMRIRGINTSVRYSSRTGKVFIVAKEILKMPDSNTRTELADGQIRKLLGDDTESDTYWESHKVCANLIPLMITERARVLELEASLQQAREALRLAARDIKCIAGDQTLPEEMMVENWLAAAHQNQYDSAVYPGIKTAAALSEKETQANGK